MDVVARHHGGKWQGATATLAAKKAKLRQEDAEQVLLLLNVADVFCSVTNWLNDLQTKRNTASEETPPQNVDYDSKSNDIDEINFSEQIAFKIGDQAARDPEIIQTFNATRSFIVVRYPTLRPLIMNNFEIQAEEVAAWLRATPLIPAIGPELWTGSRGHYLAIRLAGESHFVTEEYEIQSPSRGSSVAKFEAKRFISSDMCSQNVRTAAAIERQISGYIFGNNSKTFYYFGRITNTQDMRFAILRPIIDKNIDFIGIRIGGAEDSSPRLTFFFALQLPGKLQRRDQEIGFMDKSNLENMLSLNGFNNPSSILEKISQVLIQSKNSTMGLHS